MNLDITGAVDLHVHSSPDVYPRVLDDLALAQRAEAAGMRALLLKSHHTLTADRAALVAGQVGIDVFGGLALNWSVGGLNPVAVETAIAFGAREIWLPTLHARHCLEAAEAEMFREEARKGRPGIAVVDADGRLVAELGPILEQIRDAGIILGTGHVSPEESLVVLREARKMGIDRVLITHPQMSFTRFTVDQMRAAVALGGVLELDYLSCFPNWPGAVAPRAAAEAIRAVGFEHCILGTDGGQAHNPEPPEMLRAFATALQAEGIEADKLRAMMCTTPARLLGLD
jgi:hypothetical protein